MKLNKKALFLVLLSAIFLPFVAHGQQEDICTFASNIEALITNVGGTIVIIGWVIAGILWLISAGSPEKITTAKKATTAAIIGTALVVVAGGSFRLIQSALGTRATWFNCNPQNPR